MTHRALITPPARPEFADGRCPVCSRRGLLAGSAAGTAFAVACVLAGCSSSDETTGSGPSTDSSGHSQVVVAMNATSEPARIDPLVSWGCGRARA